METFFDPFVIVILLIQIVKHSASLEERLNCPSDCICYPDYLSNLSSWRWIEKDIHLNPNDPQHEEFNPYTEHNEVYDNPNVAKNLREDPLRTVTCILRNDSSIGLTKTFTQIPSNAQVLTLLQAAGSGNITMGKEHFEKLRSLIGIEIQGYTKKDANTGQGGNSFRLEADSFIHLHKLAYLNLENVVIQQRSLENKVPEYTSKIVRITHIGGNNTFNNEDDEIMNELESQLMFLSPNGKREDAIIMPYNEYKKEAAKQVRNHPVPTEPKVAVAFSNLPNLIHLRISNCNMQDMSWDMFYKLHNLKYLLLEKNDLLYLPDFVFYSTPNLTALSLPGNRILSLQTVGLAGLLYLQKLDMTNNNITHLSELSLPPFPHLEVADFRFNPIETIFPNTFEVMNTTKTLYLGSPTVPLTFFPNSFYGMVALTKLSITHVRIGFLEKPMLKGIPELKHLVMDGSIKRISYDAFSEVPKLEILILKNCGIEKISMDAFYGLTALIELDLSHNKLNFLSPGIFDDQVSLREVYLQGNMLTTLGRSLFTRTPVKLIRLDGNPWHCSCEMSTWNPYVVNQVKRYHISKNVSTFCQVQYDKGSMCKPEYTGFKVKYAYEKRVSPLCETPNKFHKRSVFEVIRKELRFCGLSTTTTVLPTVLYIKMKPEKINSAKPPGPVSTKTKKKNIKFEVVKTAEQLVKEQEKRLITNPVKIKKPTQNFIMTTPSVNTAKQVEYKIKSSPIIHVNPNLPTSFAPTITVTTTPELYEETTKKIETTTLLPDNPTVSPSDTPTDENQLSNQIFFKANSVQLPTVAEELRKGSTQFKRRMRQPKQQVLNNLNPRAPPISKKALKLAKLEKMDMMMKSRS